MRIELIVARRLTYPHVVLFSRNQMLKLMKAVLIAPCPFNPFLPVQIRLFLSRPMSTLRVCLTPALHLLHLTKPLVVQLSLKQMELCCRSRYRLLCTTTLACYVKESKT